MPSARQQRWPLLAHTLRHGHSSGAEVIAGKPPIVAGLASLSAIGARLAINSDA